MFWFNKDERKLRADFLKYKGICEEEYLRGVHRLLKGYSNKNNFDDRDAALVLNAVSRVDSGILELRIKYNMDGPAGDII